MRVAHLLSALIAVAIVSLANAQVPACTWTSHHNQIPAGILPCITGSYTITYEYGPEQFSVVTVVENIRAQHTNLATCQYPIPCDYVNPELHYNYTTRELKQYTISGQITVQAAASFGTALVGKVGIEAGFVIGGQYTREVETTTSVTWDYTQLDCLN